MEEKIFEFVQHMTWPAVGGLATYYIYKLLLPLVPTLSEYIQSQRKFEGGTSSSKITLDEVNANVQLIGSNHLHSLPEIGETLKRIEVSLGKLDDIKTGIEIIKSKLK